MRMSGPEMQCAEGGTGMSLHTPICLVRYSLTQQIEQEGKCVSVWEGNTKRGSLWKEMAEACIRISLQDTEFGGFAQELVSIGGICGAWPFAVHSAGP